MVIGNTFTLPPLPYKGNFQTGASSKESKTVTLFKDIYSYPPQFKLRWDALDEFQTDLCLSSNYGVLEHSLPFLDFIKDWFFYQDGKEVTSAHYSTKEFLNGYLDKINSSSFYKKKTKDIQAATAKIPIFVILNGHNEIVLNKTQAFTSSNNISLNQKVYDFCGTFDPEVEKRQQFGFFFMNPLDAEAYLQEIANADIDGVKTVGLAIHCIGLDSAYRITREHHPGIDFRFIPNFGEVKSLLSKEISKTNFITDDAQQQLRFRPRGRILYRTLGENISSRLAFMQRNEYFKGVPIYIVQLQTPPRDFLVSQYFGIVNILDTCWATIIQSLDNVIGFGHNWIMQGSLYDVNCSKQVSNYIFFEKDEAKKFVKKQGKRVVRYSGSRTSNVEPLVRKPQIYISNLEDFLELWEEKLQSQEYPKNSQYRQNLLEAKETSFIPPSEYFNKNSEFIKNTKAKPFKKFKDTVNVKYRVLKSFVGIFFSLGYS
jgi:hypothetical protein